MDSNHMVPYVKAGRVHRTIAELHAAGARHEDLYFQEVLDPNILRVMNGEFMLNGDLAGEKWCSLKFALHTPLNLRDSLEQITWRVNMADLSHPCWQNETGGIIEGLEAVTLIKHNGGPDVWEDLQEIIDRNTCPTAIIEFSVFPKHIGIYERRTIIWEVRNW